MGQVVPWDGACAGNLVVRGPWVISPYYGQAESPLLNVGGLGGGGGWLPTGDVATIDAYGCMQITDRSKDVIKSAGEWISSIDLENIASAHLDVHKAAVIACEHPKWDEPPLSVVVKKPNAELTREQLLDFFAGCIAKWQIPDDGVFVAVLPHTATAKLRMLKLREQFKAHHLSSA